MSWNPEVTTIKKVEKHPNADALDLVTIYEDIIAISKIGQYKPGDLVSYLPIDTIPGDHEMFEFLGNDRNKRIKAKRLRGIFSMGLLVPAPENFKDGDSVIDYYKLTRHFSDFEKSEYIHKDGAVLGLDSGCNEKNPKEFEIPYYDIENARKYANLFGWEEEVVISEKIHGENFSMIHDGNRLWCKSRNFYKVKHPNSKWWDYPIREDMETKLSKYPMLAFFGEYTGGVNGFRYDCEIKDGKVIRKFKLFDIYNTQTNKFLEYDEMLEIAKDINLEVAPELFRGKWTSLNDFKHLVEGSSKLNPNHIMEGFVVKSLERPKFRNNDRSILKYVSEKYLLSKHS